MGFSVSPPNATLDAPKPLDKLQESSLDSYEGVERFPFRPYPKTHRLYRTQFPMPPESHPPKQHVSEQTDTQDSANPLSTAESISLILRVAPSLKKQVDKAVKKTGVTQREFLTDAVRSAVERHLNPTDETLALSQEALTKTHEAEEALRRLTRTLSSRRDR